MCVHSRLQLPLEVVVRGLREARLEQPFPSVRRHGPHPAISGAVGVSGKENAPFKPSRSSGGVLACMGELAAHFPPPKAAPVSALAPLAPFCVRFEAENRIMKSGFLWGCRWDGGAGSCIGTRRRLPSADRYHAGAFPACGVLAIRVASRASRPGDARG